MPEIDEFKNAAACFSTGVCVCIVEKEPDEFVGITINSFASLSLNPCLIMFSVKKQSRFYTVFLGKKHFTINILSKEQKETALHFAKHAGSQLVDSQLVLEKGNQVPFLKECCANMHCELFETHEGGDHTIIIGLVTQVRSGGLAPLVYFSRGFHSIS